MRNYSKKRSIADSDNDYINLLQSSRTVHSDNE